MSTQLSYKLKKEKLEKELDELSDVIEWTAQFTDSYMAQRVLKTLKSRRERLVSEYEHVCKFV